jgi:hypothetical protein
MVGGLGVVAGREGESEGNFLVSLPLGGGGNSIEIGNSVKNKNLFAIAK